ncbi:MAG: hypothetical protein JXR53_00780, partial [Bacteroidales bacterium]|nr:hypothetical protein [Bacteroidales bacterium]
MRPLIFTVLFVLSLVLLNNEVVGREYSLMSITKIEKQYVSLFPNILLFRFNNSEYLTIDYNKKKEYIFLDYISCNGYWS